MKSIIKTKSYNFALEVITLYKKLIEQNEYVISKQLLKSGTSIGANVEADLAGQSRADFLSKMSIASKEARETNYCLRLLQDSKLFTENQQLKIQNLKLGKIVPRKKIFYALSLIFALQVLLSQNAYAYLDPGTGSYIFQVLVATLIGGLFTIKMYWQRIKNFFVNIFTNKPEK